MINTPEDSAKGIYFRIDVLFCYVFLFFDVETNNLFFFKYTDFKTSNLKKDCTNILYLQTRELIINE